MQPMPFSKLFSGAAKLYRSQFKVSVPYTFLYVFLPMALFQAVAWGILFISKNMMIPNAALRDVFQTLLASISTSFQTFSIWVIALILVPLNYARQLNLYSRAWYGYSLGFREAFVSLKNKRIKALGLSLICSLFLFVFMIGISFIVLIGLAASGALQFPQPGAEVAEQSVLFNSLSALVVLILSHGCLTISECGLLVGINEGKWGFAAIGRAWGMIKKRMGATIGGFFLFIAMKSVSSVFDYLIVWPEQMAWALQMTRSLLPTFILCFIYPLENAFFTMLYYDLRVAREGFAPLADADSPQQSLLDEGDSM